MKRLLILILIIFFTTPCFSASIFQGGVSEEGSGTSSRIVDRNTGVGVGGAKITLPKQKYSTQTDSNGYFELNTHLKAHDHNQHPLHCNYHQYNLLLLIVFY